MRFLAVLLVSCVRVPTYVSEDCSGLLDRNKENEAEEHVIACMDIGPKTNEWTDTCVRSAIEIYCVRELTVHFNDHTSTQCRLTQRDSSGQQMCIASGWKERP